MKFGSNPIRLLFVWLLLASGCSNQEVYDGESFAADSPFMRRIEGDAAMVCESARRSLLGQGYLIESSTGEEIRARKAASGGASQNTFIEMNIVCLPESRGGSTLFATGLLSEYALKKSTSAASVGVSALGSISLPIGQSADSLVKVSEETIENKGYYQRFFAAVSSILADMQAAQLAAEAEAPAVEPQTTAVALQAPAVEPQAPAATPAPATETATPVKDVAGVPTPAPVTPVAPQVPATNQPDIPAAAVAAPEVAEAVATEPAIASAVEPPPQQPGTVLEPVPLETIPDRKPVPVATDTGVEDIAPALTLEQILDQEFASPDTMQPATAPAEAQPDPVKHPASTVPEPRPARAPTSGQPATPDPAQELF